MAKARLPTPKPPQASAPTPPPASAPTPPPASAAVAEQPPERAGSAAATQRNAATRSMRRRSNSRERLARIRLMRRRMLFKRALHRKVEQIMKKGRPVHGRSVMRPRNRLAGWNAPNTTNYEIVTITDSSEDDDDVVFVSGPPRFLAPRINVQRERACARALRERLPHRSLTGVFVALSSFIHDYLQPYLLAANNQLNEGNRNVHMFGDSRRLARLGISLCEALLGIIGNALIQDGYNGMPPAPNA